MKCGSECNWSQPHPTGEQSQELFRWPHLGARSRPSSDSIHAQCDRMEPQLLPQNVATRPTQQIQKPPRCPPPQMHKSCRILQNGPPWMVLETCMYDLQWVYYETKYFATFTNALQHQSGRGGGGYELLNYRSQKNWKTPLCIVHCKAIEQQLRGCHRWGGEVGTRPWYLIVCL